MKAASQEDAWDEAEFLKCYKEIDYDGGGFIDREEMTRFIKLFANL